MSTLIATDLLWLTVQLNPLMKKTQGPLSGQKSLSDLCAEKLISDVCLLRQKVRYVPKKIFSILLSKAISNGRILSIVELIKYSPYEEIKLPVPSALEDLSSLESDKRQVAMNELKNFYDVAVSVLSVFLRDIVGQKCCSSELKTLDLNVVPISKKTLKCLTNFIHKSVEVSGSTRNTKLNPKGIKQIEELKERNIKDLGNCTRSPNLQEEYVLKCALLVEDKSDLADVIRWYSLAKSIGFQILITGMFFYNVLCPDFLVLEITKIVNVQDFKQLSLCFSDFIPSPGNIFVELRKFKNLSYFNMSHMRFTFNKDSLLQKFSVALTELTNLKHLVLRNIKLTGCLSYMFNEFCKRKLDSATVTDCCLAHSGSLEYLDISGCYLCGEDLRFLEEISASNSLKYLDISYNSLSATSTLQTLLFLSSSLLVLNMAYCFQETVEYNSESFPLRAFTKIRILNMKGMAVTPRSKQMLYSELEKMTFDSIKTDDEPPYDEISYEQFLALHSLQS